jgi:hypothetical protein
MDGRWPRRIGTLFHEPERTGKAASADVRQAMLFVDSQSAIRH